MPSYAITTFGCQMNVHDSERLSGLLEDAGYVEIEKTFRGKIPLTLARLTAEGRAAFQS